MKEIVKYDNFEVKNEPLKKGTWLDINEVFSILEEIDDKGWRLPTLKELQIIHLNKEKINFEPEKYYWSSETNGNSGFCLCIEDGTTAKVKLHCTFPSFLVRDYQK